MRVLNVRSDIAHVLCLADACVRLVPILRISRVTRFATIASNYILDIHLDPIIVTRLPFKSQQSEVAHLLNNSRRVEFFEHLLLAVAQEALQRLVGSVGATAAVAATVEAKQVEETDSDILSAILVNASTDLVQLL